MFACFACSLNVECISARYAIEKKLKRVFLFWQAIEICRQKKVNRRFIVPFNERLGVHNRRFILALHASERSKLVWEAF